MRAEYPNVCAVVVSYHPQPQQLAALLASLASQVRHVVLIDNGSGVETQRTLQALAQNGAIDFIPQSVNGGIAQAQNAGIEFALRRGSDFVWLMDQDSLPQPGTLTTLLSALVQLPARTAAVGPCFVDRRTGQQSHFVRFRHGLLKRQPQAAGQEIVPVDFLIASGMLIPAQVLRVVGLMDEGLFIDHVDTEWCLRAGAAGYRLFGVTQARMAHELGDGSIRLGVFGRRAFPNHHPLRYYYGTRNVLLLLRHGYIPLLWRITLLLRGLLISVCGLLLLPKKLLRIKMMVRGLVDGMARRVGPFPG